MKDLSSFNRAVDGDPSWLRMAFGEIGQKEIAGNAHNRRIIEYHLTTTLKGSRDEIPWCSSFVNWIMVRSGYAGTGSASARSWLGWGKPSVMRRGSIVVLSRGPNPASGHVGFVVHWTPSDVIVLGGNQSNAVNLTRFPTGRITAVRQPAAPLTPDAPWFDVVKPKPIA